MLRGIAPGTMSPAPNITPDVSTRQGELVCLYRSLLGSMSGREASRKAKEKRRAHNQATLSEDADDGTASPHGSSAGSGNSSASEGGSASNAADQKAETAGSPQPGGSPTDYGGSPWERVARELLLSSLQQMRAIVPALVAV